MLYDTEGMQIVVKAQAVGTECVVKRSLARVSEWRMADVVHESQRFRQVLIQAKCDGNRPGNLRHFHCVRKAAAEMIRIAMREDLRLAGKTAKGAGVNDASTVALKCGAIWMRRLRKDPRRKWIVCGVRDSATGRKLHEPLLLGGVGQRAR